MKKTLIYHVSSIEDPALSEAARILNDGGTVVFPTETVYGLGANALSNTAVEKIFAAKGRPSDNPLIVHVSSIEDAEQLAEEIPEVAHALAKVFWPGPLTLIFPKKDSVPDSVTAGLTTVAVRIPAHEIARKLIGLAGVPIAAPSANISGRPSPTRGIHAIEDLEGRVDCILWSDDSPVGLESTVVDVTVWPPVVLRPGGVTIEELRRIVPQMQVDPALENMGRHLVPKSPGMKYAHYAPRGEMILFEGKEQLFVEAVSRRALKALDQGKKVAVLCLEEHKMAYAEFPVALMVLGSLSAPQEVAKNLFECLRACDALGVDVILAEGVPEAGIGHAVMNRFRKAAGYQIEKL